MGEGERGMIWENSIETCILSSVKQITSPGWMHETSVQGWYTGMGRGESGWGTHLNPWLIHVNVWQKPLQYCKVISLQLIKTIGKKKRIEKRIKNYTHIKSTPAGLNRVRENMASLWSWNRSKHLEPVRQGAMWRRQTAVQKPYNTSRRPMWLKAKQMIKEKKTNREGDWNSSWLDRRKQREELRKS